MSGFSYISSQVRILTKCLIAFFNFEGYGEEVINEAMATYCQQEQITFARECSKCLNDNCSIEQGE